MTYMTFAGFRRWEQFRNRPVRRKIWSDMEWECTESFYEADWMQRQECDYFGPDRPILHVLFDWMLPWRRK